MYSRGSSAEHSSDDERGRNNHQNRHSRPSSSNGRRAPVDLPEDDDSDGGRRNYSHSRSPAGSSSKRRSNQYDDDDDDDDHHDDRSKHRGRDQERPRSRRTVEDERNDYDDEDDIKPIRNGGGPSPSEGGKSGRGRNNDRDGGKHRDDYEERDGSDDDGDDRHINHKKRSSNGGGGVHSSEKKQRSGKKRAHSDDEYEDDRHDRRVREDDEDEIEKEEKPRVKRERYDDDDDEIREERDRQRRRDDRFNDIENDRDDVDVKTDVGEDDGQGKNLTFDKAVERTKAGRRRNEPDQEVVEHECVSFLERMRKARDDDLKAFQRGEPALEKIKMLRDVERMMTKVHHREYLLDNFLLAAFRSWLDRLPDGSLPNLQVRSTLLQLLLDLRIDEDWVDRLESSQGLGKVIHFLSKKDDHEPNKRIAEKIMMKWARPVYRMNSNFQDLLYEFDKPDEGHRAGKESMAAERKAAMRTVHRLKTTEEKLRDSRRGKEDTRIMASAPRPTPFLFTTVAEGTTHIDDKMAREIKSSRAKQKKMSRTMSNLRRLTKGSGARGSKPSINGR